MTEVMKQLTAPKWCEEKNGVYIPLIDKVLEAKNLDNELLNWFESIELAREHRKQIASKEEMLFIYLQRKEINAILKEHGGDLLIGSYGTSSERGPIYMWAVNFVVGNVYCTNQGDQLLYRTVAKLR